MKGLQVLLGASLVGQPLSAFLEMCFPSLYGPAADTVVSVGLLGVAMLCSLMLRRLRSRKHEQEITDAIRCSAAYQYTGIVRRQSSR